MKFSNEELNILLDGLHDTKIRIGTGQIVESYDYIQKVLALKKRMQREMQKPSDKCSGLKGKKTDENSGLDGQKQVNTKENFRD